MLKQPLRPWTGLGVLAAWADNLASEAGARRFGHHQHAGIRANRVFGRGA
jgi:hypothetical protein